MGIKTFDFIGESAYVESVEKIRKHILFLQDDDYAFDMAINEAVLNAAQNSVDGPDKAKIHIEIHVTGYDVIVKVVCKTHPFDMLAYREQLRAVAARPEFKDKDWTDYVADSDSSRGIWFMLYGSEYIYFDQQSQYVSLCSRNPCISGPKTKKMTDLLMRFYVINDGVLL